MKIVFVADYEWAHRQAPFPYHTFGHAIEQWTLSDTSTFNGWAHNELVKRVRALDFSDTVMFVIGRKSLACLYNKHESLIPITMNDILDEHPIRLAGHELRVWFIQTHFFSSKRRDYEVYRRAAKSAIDEIVNGPKEDAVMDATLVADESASLVVPPWDRHRTCPTLDEITAPVWWYDIGCIDDDAQLYGVLASGDVLHARIPHCCVDIYITGIPNINHFMQRNHLPGSYNDVTVQPFTLYTAPCQAQRVSVPLSGVAKWKNAIRWVPSAVLYDAHLPLELLIARQHRIKFGAWSDADSSQLTIDQRPRPALRVAAIDVQFSSSGQVEAWEFACSDTKFTSSSTATNERDTLLDLRLALAQHPIDILVAYRFATSVIPLMDRFKEYGIPSPFSQAPLPNYWNVPVPKQHGSVGGLGCFYGVLPIDLYTWAYTTKVAAEPTLSGLAAHFSVTAASTAESVLGICMKQQLHWTLIEHARVLGVCPTHLDAYGRMQQTQALFYSHASGTNIVFPESTTYDDDNRKTFKGGFNLQRPGMYTSVVQLDGKHYYPSIIIAHNICITKCRTVDSTREDLVWHNQDHGYVSGELGFIPKVCQYLLDQRARVQEQYAALLATNPDADGSVLMQEETALKLSANVVYGCLPHRQLSEDVAAIARDILQQSVTFCESTIGPVIAADTDSLMIHVPSVPEGQDAFETIKPHFDELNRRVGPHIVFKYEGTAKRILLQTSKRRAFFIDRLVMKGLEATQYRYPAFTRTTLAAIVKQILQNPFIPQVPGPIMRLIRASAMQLISQQDSAPFVLYQRLKSPATKVYELYEKNKSRLDTSLLPGYLAYVHAIDLCTGERLLRLPQDLGKRFIVDKVFYLTSLFWRPISSLLLVFNPDWRTSLDSALTALLGEFSLHEVPFSNQMAACSDHVYICPVCVSHVHTREHSCPSITYPV